MQIYSSNTARGFFSPGFNDILPSDAQELSAAEYQELKDGQAAGKIIDWSGAKPSLTDLPVETVEQAHADRLAAYRRESDPLKIEAEYDAILAGTEPDYATWLAKVAEIKMRYPLPG